MFPEFLYICRSTITRYVMKRFFNFCILALALVCCLAACKGGSKTLLPSVSGKAGEVLVVIDKDNWEGAVGNAARELLADECPYLAQREPLYTLVNVTPAGFESDLFKIHRNVVMFRINPQIDSAGVFFRKDVWSSPQCVIQVASYDADSAVELLQKKGQLIVRSIEQAERDRVILSTMRYEEKSIYETVSAQIGGSPHFPAGYKFKKVSPEFCWIANDKQYVYQDVFVYRYPAEADHPFSSANIIKHRNEILKRNVPGMFENTYMTTSGFFTPMIEYLKYRGRDIVQTRGMWEVENDYMGGPFVSHSFYSPDGKEIVVAEAFVYAPRYDKRQYLRQVESLLYSWEWDGKDQKEEK